MGKTMNAVIWNRLSFFEQLSNIDGEVTRLVEDHERFQKEEISDDHALDYIKCIIKLVDMTFADPKNYDKRIIEKELTDEIGEILRYLNGDYSSTYITKYWHQFTDAIS